MHTHIHVKMVRKFCTQHTIHTNKSSDDNSRTLANEKKNRKQNRINCMMYVYGVFIVPIGQIPKLHISYYRFFFRTESASYCRIHFHSVVSSIFIFFSVISCVCALFSMPRRLLYFICMVWLA